jgi:hypothetical protein
MNEELPPFFTEEDAKKLSVDTPKKGGSGKTPVIQEHIFGPENGYIHFTMSVTTPYFAFKKLITVKERESMVTEVIGYLPGGIKFTISFFGKTAVAITKNIQ